MGEHVNTFQNGLTSDCNIVLQPDGTYRYLKNCSLISQDGNNYVIKDCMGNVKVFTINPPYVTNYSTVGTLPMPIGFISFPDKLIVFSTNNTSETGGYGEIGMIKYLPYGEGIKALSVAGEYNAGYVPLYHHLSLNFTQLRRIEGFAYQENDVTQRVYWTDNLNEPRVFDVGNSAYTTYIASGSLSATVGTQYMVVEGAVTYSGTDYGPGLPAGNIITTAGAVVAYTDLTTPTPTAKVIAYTPYQLLNFTPSRSFGNIQFNNYGSGSVNCGHKVYFIRYGLSNGYRTPWSYGSSPVHVGTTNTYVTTYDYHDFVGAGSSSTLINSAKSVFMDITNIDTNYNVVEMACAEFDQSATVPRLISVVNSSAITGVSMTLEHTGAVNAGTLTLNDLTLFPASILKVKSMTTNKNFNLIANITERAEFSTTFAATITSFQYPLPVFRDPNSCSMDMIYLPVDAAVGVNPPATEVQPREKYYVYNAPNAGNRVEYPVASGTYYNTGDVFTGVSGSTTATFTGTAQARPCATTNRYTPFGTAQRRENAVILEDYGFLDYKHPAIDQHCRGYWSAEKYRFGVLFYDLKGNPFYVRWLWDYTFPTLTAKGGATVVDTYLAANFYSLNVSGAKISNLVIPTALMDQISGFSIVRAERDPRVITQGLVGQLADNGATPQDIYPIAWAFPGNDANPLSTNGYSYLCPDQLVNAPMKSSIGQIGDTMESAGWLDAIPYTGSVYVRASGGEEQIVSKWITPLTGDATLRTGTISLWKEYNEGEVETNFDGFGSVFRNTLNTAAAGCDPDPACIGAVPYNLNTNTAQGGKKVIFYLTADFLHYGPAAYGYTNAGGNAVPKKVLMNYCKANTNQYGGTGAAALANTLYISTGHFQPITATVKSETANGAGGYTFNNIEVFGGDCYMNLVDYGYGLYDDTFSPDSFSYAWSFVCESNANYGLRRGRKPSNVEMYYTGTAMAQSIAYLTPTPSTRLEDFSYNPGYTTEGENVKYPALPDNYVNAVQFKERIRFAGPKLLGEVVDSFRTFLTNDYHDVDVQGGEINKIVIKDGRVIVFQNKMMATVPVLERQLLSNIDGAATTLGTGGVVDRHDPINSYFGTQHQWSVTETEYGFAWFDMRRKAFMVFDTGINEVSQILGLKGFFDEIFVEAVGDNLNNQLFINSPTFAETSDRPLVGVGITGVYDPKFKTTYMTFKFVRQNYNGNYALLNKDFTIGYYHPKRQFIGFFDWTPAIAHNHNQLVISANNPKNKTIYYGALMPGNLAVAVGDVVNGGTSEYINKVALTIVAYPGTAGPGGTNPTTGTNNWTKINSTNEIWVHNQPSSYFIGIQTATDYLYNKVFGQVVDNEIQYVVNPQTRNPFSCLSMEEMVPYDVRYTDVYVSAANQSASDTSIRSTSTFVRFIYDRICSTFPLSSTGRITNNHLLVRLAKKNWTTVPTTITTSVKILIRVITKYVEKR